MVYYSVLNRITPWDEYTAERGAVVERRYTRVEAAQKAADTGNYGGPWHTSPIGASYSTEIPPPVPTR